MSRLPACRTGIAWPAQAVAETQILYAVDGVPSAKTILYVVGRLARDASKTATSQARSRGRKITLCLGMNDTLYLHDYSDKAVATRWH